MGSNCMAPYSRASLVPVLPLLRSKSSLTPFLPFLPSRFDLWPMRDLCGLQQKLDLHRIKRKDDLAGLCAAKHTSIQ